MMHSRASAAKLRGGGPILFPSAAREMKLDPVALRRRNFVPNDGYPYTTPVALTYDSGDYFKTLDMAVNAADYAGFERRRQEAGARIRDVHG